MAARHVLGVDARPTGALVLFEEAGMRVVEHFTRREWSGTD